MKPLQPVGALLGLAVGGALISVAGAWPHSPRALEEKVEAILAQLTLEEKVALCLGAAGMEFKGVPRLDLPNMVCTDGPRGPGQSTGQFRYLSQALLERA